MNTAVYGPLFGTDMRGTIWGLWWLDYAIKHDVDAEFTTMVAYPFGLKSGFSNLSIFFILTKCLIFFTNEIFLYNFILLFNFFLSAIYAFLLVFFLTKSLPAAFVSGIVFSFCPYHFMKSWEHFSLVQTFWIPSYALTLIHLFKNPSVKKSILVALVFSMIMSFDFTYTYIAAVMTLFFGLFVFIYGWRYKYLKVNENVDTNHNIYATKPFAFKVFKMLLLIIPIIIIAKGYVFYSIIKGVSSAVHSNEEAIHAYTRSFHYLFTHSARPLSYLLPASVHPVFGKFTESLFGTIFYGRNAIEQTLYLGWAPLILSFIAFRKWKKNRIKNKNFLDEKNAQDDFVIGLFIFCGIGAFVFSMPPYFDFLAFKLYFPSFFMYKLLPMFRAYARFGVIVMLCVSVLAGFGLKYILEKIKTKKVKLLVIFLVFSIIIFEFINIPPFRVADLTKVPEVYKWLKKEKGDFVIVEYPIGIGSAGEAQENYDYLYYQTIHEKRLVNGASIGTKAFELKKRILKVDSPETAGILKGIRVKYLILHPDLYKKGECDNCSDVIGEIPELNEKKGYRLFKTFDNALVYEIIAEPIAFKIK